MLHSNGATRQVFPRSTYCCLCHMGTEGEKASLHTYKLPSKKKKKSVVARTLEATHGETSATTLKSTGIV